MSNFDNITKYNLYIEILSDISYNIEIEFIYCLKGEKIMRKFNAFTLAEVLITLGIIGVVAAMTMPTLINQTNGAQYKAAYKKAMSAISQAVTLNVAQDDVSFADTVTGSHGTLTAPAGGVSVASLLTSRMNVVNNGSMPSGYTIVNNDAIKVNMEVECNDPEQDEECSFATLTKFIQIDFEPDTFIAFKDGSALIYKADDVEKCTTDKQCLGLIDVNGIKGPNKIVTDGSKPTDIYPVVFYDQRVLPGSDSAKAVLYGK